MADIVALERRIKRLEDIEEIRDLKIRYVLAIEHRQADVLNDCFAEEATADFGSRVFDDRESVVRWFKEGWPKHFLQIHHGHDHRIRITGDTTAEGTQSLLVMVGLTDGSTKKAYWAASTTDDQYVKENGEWRIRRTVIHLAFFTEYEKGWAQDTVSHA